MTKPMTAPTGHYKFMVTNATIISGEPGNVYSYSLSQNYPNPFNPSTTINFTLSKAGKTSIKVYDVLGRERAVLLDAVKEAGSHFVNFDASSLAGGIYFYKIQSGDYSETRKMMLIK